MAIQYELYRDARAIFSLWQIWKKSREEKVSFPPCEDNSPSGAHENEDYEEGRLVVNQYATRSPISIVPELLEIPERRIYWQDPF